MRSSGQLSRLSKVLIWVGVFLVLAAAVAVVVAETYLRSTAEAQIAKDLKRYYNLAELPIVRIEGSPFSWKILTGSLDSISAEMNNLDTSQFASGEDRFAAALKIAHMRIVLRDISFSPVGILGGQKSFAAKSGSLEARIAEADFNSYMRSSGVKVTFSLAPGNTRASATLSGQGQTFEVTGTGTFSYQAGQLTFEPTKVSGDGVSNQVAMNALSVTRPMPSIGGIHPTGIEAGEGELILFADVDAFTFEPIAEDAPPTPITVPTATPTPAVSPVPPASPSPTGTRRSPTATATKKSPTKSPTPTSTRRS